MRAEEKLTWYSDTTGDSIEFSVDSDYWFSAAENMDRLNNNISTIQGIGQDGKYVTGAQLAEREITITAQIVGDYETCRAELIEKINPKHTGRLVYENATVTRYIRCYVKASPACERGIYPNVEIDFYCAYPFWKDGDGVNVTQTSVSRWVANLEFPLEITDEGLEIEYRMPALVANIVNTGHQPAELIIDFMADLAVSDPILTNIVTQEFFQVDYDMLEGDVIRVKTGYGVKSITLIRDGEETNIYDKKVDDSTWLLLAVGDNYLRASASVDDNITVKVYYEFAYNGV